MLWSLVSVFRTGTQATVPGKLTTNTQTSREHANAAQLQYFYKPVFLVSLFKRHIISRSITNHSPLLKQCNVEQGYNQVDGETQLVDHESSVFSHKHHCQGDFLISHCCKYGKQHSPKLFCMDKSNCISISPTDPLIVAISLKWSDFQNCAADVSVDHDNILLS